MTQNNVIWDQYIETTRSIQTNNYGRLKRTSRVLDALGDWKR